MLKKLAIATVLVGAAVALMTPAQASGRMIKVYGADLASADRVAVIVPGADTTAATFEDSARRPGGAARALLAQAAGLSPGTRLAVVAWLGYDAPPTWSLGALTDSAAVEGARELRRTVLDLHRHTAAPIALLCHSYGSVLCAAAAPGLPVSDLAVFGSPGLGGARTATDLAGSPAEWSSSGDREPVTTVSRTALTASAGTPAPASTPRGAVAPGDHVRAASGEAVQGSTLRVWAARGRNDWIRFVPHTRIGPVGFGTDPMSRGFGARHFDAGAGGHSDYFTPGTPSLRNLTWIALGHPARVTAAPTTP
ncbi:alpha/beta hydrolase [Nonomuraea pusilla]|uniref:alpha/beta hydrolase n=1 Tax=Nonomuraea pusilla TaxID=46177 RepID=UPI003323DD00